TTLNLVTGDGAKVQSGCMLQDETTGKTELIMVTSVSTDALTVTRDYGGVLGSGETHANSAVYKVVGFPRNLKAEMAAFSRTTRVENWNYVQMFQRIIEIPKSWGYFKSTVLPEGEFRKEVARKTLDIKNEMSRTVVLSERGSETISSEKHYTMRGLRNAIIQNSGNTDTTAEALTETVLNDLNDLVYADVNEEDMPGYVMTTAPLARVIAGWDAGKIRTTQNERTAGSYKNRYITDLGNTLEVVINNELPAGDLILLPRRNPIIKRNLIPYMLAPVVSTTTANEWVNKVRLITAFSVQIPNAAQRYALHTALTTS
ncbi:MAG: DUF5309 family protein, partial [Terriglobia bacterium]